MEKLSREQLVEIVLKLEANRIELTEYLESLQKDCDELYDRNTELLDEVEKLREELKEKKKEI